MDKETIIGLLVALEELDENQFKEKSSKLKAYLEKINVLIHSIKRVTTEMTEDYLSAHPILC